MSKAVPVKKESMILEISGDVNNDDDEIVREIDVYISPALSDQLYLIQYPLYHEAPLPDAARIKKKHTMIELDHKVPNNIGTEGSYFLASRTQVSHVISITTHMAMGKILSDGALHLLPLNHITQMRPDFAHVDEVDQQNQSSEDDRKDQQAQAGLEKKPVLFQKKESERAALARKSSYSYKKASEDGEEWLELSICGPQSQEFFASEQKIMSSMKNIQIASGDCKNFVKSLDYLPARSDMFDDEPQEGSSPLVSIVKRLTAMLHRGVPVTYSVIRPQFPPTVDDADLLLSLGSCAVLVRGNFYLQSRLLLWDHPQLAFARNFILYLLHTMGHIQRRGLEEVFRTSTAVGSEWIHTLLNQVAVRGTHGWMPRLADNIEFCLAFPETMQLHNQYWERQMKKFEAMLVVYEGSIHATKT
jgi:DNA-directed RNA polymerase III subunit RPC5